MIVFINFFFKELIIAEMSEIHLNKFEKEEKVIELHKEGKTIRAIAPIVHMSFSPISKIIKAYDKKIQLDKKKENNQQKTKQQKSLSSRAFIMFKKGKQIDETKILLDIPYKLAFKYWRAYLKSIRIFEAYEFYQIFRNDIPTLLSIAAFIKRNDIPGKNIVDILRTATDVNSLNKIYYNLKTEIKNLEQKRMFLQYYSPSPYSLQPLPLNKPNYNYYRY